MKKCGYCGFDNDDTAQRCSDCEQSLVGVAISTQPTQPPQLSPPKPPRPLAIRILGWIVLIIGGFATAATVAQMGMGMGGDAAHLVVGAVLVIVGLVMAAPSSQAVAAGKPPNYPK